MQKQTFIFFLLAVSLILTGCAGQAAAEEEVLQPLDQATWPTPVAAQATASPTPFPKIDLEDVVTPTPVPIEEDEAVAVAEVMEDDLAEAEVVAQTQSASPANEPAQTVAAIIPTGTLPLDSLARITDGQVTISAVNVRQGPGPDYATLGALRLGQVVDVLATNAKQDWVLVEGNDVTGWVSLTYLDLLDTSKTLPVVRVADPTQYILAGDVAPIIAADGAQAAVPAGETQPMVASVANSVEPNVIALGPVAVGHLAVDKTEVRPGPGFDFAAIDELREPLEKLTILAVDPGRQWALVDPEFDSSRVGWVVLRDLQVSEGDLATAPEIYTGWTNSNALALRGGPGIFAAEVGRLPINNIVRVVGLNEGRSWALVQPVLGGGEGWTQIKYLTLSAKISHLPLAPAPAPAPTPVSIDPAAAAASAKQGKLALQLSSGGEIVTLDADGSGLQTVTHGIDPQLSPDGSRLAFTRWEGGEAGNGTLWVRDLTTGNETAVLGFIKQPKGPDWSPDGSQIVINYQHEGRLTDKSISVDLTKNSSPAVPWNAGGVRVKVEDGTPHLNYTLPPDPHWGLRVIDVIDGSYEDTDGGTYAFRPAWDPSQAWRIVSDGGRGLLAIDVNRKDYQTKLTENLSDGSPVFSADGRYIALSAGKQGGSDGYDIYRLNGDGSGRVRLTETPLWVAVTPEGDGRRWNNVSPAWSPDGTQIAFLTDRTGRWEVWVMNADGSNQRPMFSEAINDQLKLTYNFVDERMISWR